MITPRRLVRRSIGTFLGLGGVACCLTLLFLSSRVLLSIGGSCGSGGSYVVATPCPDGIGWILPVSILGGLAALGVYMASLLPVGPRLVPLAWPALFLGLGWNFLRSALSEPDVAAVFMICAVLFALLGAAPLFFLANGNALRAMFWGPAPPVPSRPAPLKGDVRWTTSVALPGDDDPPRDAPRFAELTLADAPAGDGSGDLVGQLERLSALHQTGRLDDDEYATAKARLLNGSR